MGFATRITCSGLFVLTRFDSVMGKIARASVSGLVLQIQVDRLVNKRRLLHRNAVARRGRCRLGLFPDWLHGARGFHMKVAILE